MGSSKMDTYVEPEIEEVQGPMDEDDMKMDACGCQENISMHGNLFLKLFKFVVTRELQYLILIWINICKSMFR